MFLAGLAALSKCQNELSELPTLLGLSSVRIEVGEVDRKGILATQVKIFDSSPLPSRARHLSDIFTIIESARIPDRAKNLSKRIFEHLAVAEAEVHRCSVEEVHFHEVGAIDSIVDIVGSSWLFDRLNVERAFSNPVCTGFGLTRCEHGMMPVPAPATELLLAGVPIFRGEVEKEMTTPTGAAILKGLDFEFSDPKCRVLETQWGAGLRDNEVPNCLRLRLAVLETGFQKGKDSIWVLCANLDDISGEILGQSFQEKCFAKGALDVFSLSDFHEKRKARHSP